MTTHPDYIEVLLATFNGARFLPRQLDSILAQTHPPTTILARDDGSTDATPQILADYAARHPTRIAILETLNPNPGAKGNFLTLLQHSTAPYVAFADQDDVWLPEKLARQLTALQTLPAAKPALCFSDLRIVDQNLCTLHPSFWQHERHNPAAAVHLNRLLLQNVVVGCTALLNRSLATLACHMPPEAHMHDWWTALLACAFGRSTWLAEPTVLYRQHSANVFGASTQPTPTGLPDRANDTGRRTHWLAAERQAEALLRIHGPQLTPAQRTLLQAMITCETSPSRLRRVLTLLRHRLFMATPRLTGAMLLHLWDK